MSRPPIDVVVIDDAEDVRRVVTKHLALDRRLAVVAEGASAADAVRLAAEHHPEVMLLDYAMPGADGVEVLPEIAAASPGTIVVMLSGFTDREIVSAAKDAGAAAFLDKTDSLEGLAGRLVEIVEATEGHLDWEAPAIPADREALSALRLERFDTVFDQSATGMATMTLAGTIIRANAALVSLVGATQKGELIGRHFASLVPPVEEQPVRQAIAEAAGGAAASTARDHELSDSGAGVRVLSVFTPVRDEDGRPLYLFAEVEDNTGRRTAAERLRASEERFRLFVESVKDYAVFMLDTEGRVSSWNAGAERLKGYSADDIIGQHFRVFYPEDAQRARHPEEELEIAAREGRYDEEGWRVRKDGSRFYANVVITALFDEEGHLAGFGKVTRDVTEQRRNSEARERAAAELSAANETLRANAKALSDFTALVAHELRSPATAITGAAGLLSEHPERLEEHERAELLASISQGGTRLMGLIGDLLTASRLEAGIFELKLETLPAAATLVEIFAELAALAEVRIARLCRPELTIRADRQRLGQIIANLVQNAARHGRPPITVAADEIPDGVELRVCDAGEAIPSEVSGRFFEKFFQGPATRREGSGLGLYIVRELARAQGGDAWYEVAEGRNCFAVRLPADESAPPG